MAFAPPDPKKVEAQKQREIDIQRQKIAAIRRERERMEQIRACYHDYSPKQIRHAGRMMQAGKVAQKCEDAIPQRIGRSKRGNLYLMCKAVA